MDRFDELLTNIDKYLLMLFYSKDQELIRGKTWLQKEMFLIGQNVEEVGKKYDAYLKGPFSEAVEKSADQFERSNYVIVDRGKMSLTDKGVQLAKKIWESRSDEDKRMVEDMKALLNDMTYNELLVFVYTSYPETTKESDIKEDIEKVRLPVSLRLVKKGKISVEKGAEVAGIHLLDFVEELKKRGIKRF